MSIKDVIAQAEKRFDTQFAPQLFDEKQQNEAMAAYISPESYDSRVKDFIRSYTKDLLQSVVEMAEKQTDEEKEQLEAEPEGEIKEYLIGKRNGRTDIIANLKQ